MLSTIVCFPLLIFLNLEPLVNGGKNAKQIPQNGNQKCQNSRMPINLLSGYTNILYFPLKSAFHYRFCPSTPVDLWLFWNYLFEKRVVPLTPSRFRLFFPSPPSRKLFFGQTAPIITPVYKGMKVWNIKYTL